ncbi:MAG TPA: tetratricopeptide repeat protein [Pirellulales bacterium]|jgi:tetratricopeptide (TPR) repeat protein
MKRPKTVPKPRSPAPSPSAQVLWLWGGGLVLLVGIVYWPTLANGFIWDDDEHIEHNQTLSSTVGLRDIWFKTGAVPQYYPLTHSIFWIEHRCWGLDPRGYHLVNLLLHAASTVLVWRLLVWLAAPGAWMAAAIFAVHPVCVESVAWVTELKNVLSCALALGSMLAYLRFSPADVDPAFDHNSDHDGGMAALRRAAWRYYGLSFVLFVAAVLSKTVVASVPAVLLVIYWWQRGRVSAREFARMAPFFAFGLALSVITIWMERTHVGASGQEWDLAPPDRVLIAGRALWFYAGKLAWPHPLIFFYPRWAIDAYDPWQYLYPLAAMLTVIGLWCVRARIGRGPLAAVLIFAGVLVPALGFINVYPFRYSFVADHFQYHASIALVSLAAAGLALFLERRAQVAAWAIPLVGLGVLIPLAAIARDRTYAYRDIVTLHENTLALNPTAWNAPLNLGDRLYNDGNFAAAAEQYLRATRIVEELVRAHRHEAHQDNNLAACYVSVGLALYKDRRWDDANAYFEKARAIRERLVREYPNAGEFHDGLAWCYANMALNNLEAGRPAAAEVPYRKAIEIRELRAQALPAKDSDRHQLAFNYTGLGMALRDSGRPADGERWLDKAILEREQLVEEAPANATYREALGWCYGELAATQQAGGKLADAESTYDKTIDLRRQLAIEHPHNERYRQQLAASYDGLATLLRTVQRQDEAQEALDQAAGLRGGRSLPKNAPPR